MGLEVEVKGLNELLAKLKSVEEIMKKLGPVMLKIALKVENDAKEFVVGRKPMDRFQQEAAEQLHAMKVGEQSLGVLFGTLRRSIKGVIEEITSEYVSAVVSSAGNVVYARIHELGGIIENAFGRGITVVMPARPYLFASLLKNKEWIQKTLQEEIIGILETL